MKFFKHISLLLVLLQAAAPLVLRAQIEISPLRQEQAGSTREEQRLAIQYYQNREYEKAVEMFTGLYDKEPSHINYTYYLYSLLELREYREAEKLVRKHLRKNSDQLRYHVDLGFVYGRASEYDKAQKKFEEVIDRMPASIHGVKETANLLFMRQQNDYAIRAYLRGRELLKGEYTFSIELATMYERNGNYPEMVETYLDHLYEHPESIEEVQNRFQNAFSRDIESILPDLLRESLLVRYQQSPDEIYLNEMLLWLSVQLRDFSFAFVQARSLDKRFREDGSRVLGVAELAQANRDFESAIEAYQYILGKGKDSPLYLNGLIGFLEARYQQIADNIVIGETALLQLEEAYLEAIEEFGIQQRTIRLLRDLAHLQAFHLSKEEDAIHKLITAIEVPGPESIGRAQCKLELADIYLFMDEVWEATLLYSQVEKTFKNEPIGHEAKLKNARLTYYIGEFEWARAQLDVLKSATSKLIANDALELSLFIGDNTEADSSYAGLQIFSRAELLFYMNRYEEALQMLDSVYTLAAWHPLFDEVLYKKAEISIRQGRYLQADSLLQQISLSYPDDILGDDALFRRAQLQEEAFGNTEKAMELYRELLIRYPGSVYTMEARRKFRNLRGDDV